MKLVLSKRTKLEKNETVALIEKGNAILHQNLPLEQKDLRGFHIPCTIGTYKCEKALSDLGSSVNLMPLLVFKKLGLGEVKPTTVSLQLVDRYIRPSNAILEDVLVKDGSLICPTDFLVLEMDEDLKIPIILGQTFLATLNAAIDVLKGELSLGLDEEKVTFSAFHTPKKELEVDSYYQLDVVEGGLDENKGIQASLHPCHKRKVKNKDLKPRSLLVMPTMYVFL